MLEAGLSISISFDTITYFQVSWLRKILELTLKIKTSYP
jgi:hypothetical protein